MLSNLLALLYLLKGKNFR